jgi:hypothetical protein
MPCSIQVGSNGSVAVAGGGVAWTSSGDGSSPQAAIGFPCSCSCSTSRTNIAIAGAGPTQAPPTPTIPIPPTVHVPPTAVFFEVAAPVASLPAPPRQDDDLLAFGLLLVFGACAALLLICGLWPASRRKQATSYAGQEASAAIAGVEAQAQYVMDLLSAAHLAQVEQLTRRSG